MKKFFLILLVLSAVFASAQTTYTLTSVSNYGGNLDSVYLSNANDSLYRQSWPSGTYISFAKQKLLRWWPISKIYGLQTVLDGKGTSSFSGSYIDLSNKPSLFDGAYNSLTGKPSLFDGAYSSLTGKPSLFDGVYSSLSSKPDLTVYKLKSDSGFVGSQYVTGGDIRRRIDSIAAAMAATYSTTSHTHTFASLTGKPTTLSGYGITDAQSALNGTGFIKISGTTISYDNSTYLTTTGSAANLTNFPTFNQNTIGSAAKWTTARNLWGVSTDGSADVNAKFTNYNATTLAGNGMPSIVAVIDATAQAANIATATLYAVPSAGFYRINIYITVTQAATTSSTMPSTTITYTDGNAGTNSHSTTTTATSTGNSVTTTFAQTTYVLYAKASTNIQYAAGSYASSGATAMQYALRIRVEAL